MPGFMQSLKSPFANKKNAIVNPSAEEVALAEESPIAQEQPSSEVLPAEALVQQTSSTVALTLTPANGESSQHATSENAEEVTPPEDPTTQSDLPIETDSTPQEASHAAEPTEVQSKPTPVEIVHATPESTEALPPSVQAESDAPVSDLPTDFAENVVVPTPEVEAVQPQAEVTSHAVESSEPPACAVASNEASTADVVPTPVEVEVSRPSAKVTKDSYSCNVKRSKSKKQKADASTEVTEAGQSVSTKPRKSHPLADKLRSVIEQVKCKVKKDKETACSPLAAEAVEPTPIVEEIAASA